MPAIKNNQKKMQLTESSIYINLKRLRNLLYEAQFRMTTANRVVFGNTLMKYSAETISNFILAFTVGDKKYVEFDRHRCCLVARDSNRNRIIKNLT